MWSFEQVDRQVKGEGGAAGGRAPGEWLLGFSIDGRDAGDLSSGQRKGNASGGQCRMTDGIRRRL